MPAARGIREVRGIRGIHLAYVLNMTIKVAFSMAGKLLNARRHFFFSLNDHKSMGAIKTS